MMFVYILFSCCEPPTRIVIADIWTKLGERGPRVHCITNSVVQAFTANVLLAAGAIPSTSTDPGEISHFVHYCDSLLVNLGTLDAPRQLAIAIAIDVATTARKRWVLDPVFIEVAVNRLETAKQLLLRRPTIVRANRTEMKALIETDLDIERLRSIARLHETVLCVSGESDLIVAAGSTMRVENGHKLARSVTGTGCALAALVAALSAVTDDAVLAAAAAHTCFGIAVQLSATEARGPGTLAVTLPDWLYRLDAAIILEQARMH
jgi:hydroxyethylthiazole kinase